MAAEWIKASFSKNKFLSKSRRVEEGVGGVSGVG
jgi:hypothetical protein